MGQHPSLTANMELAGVTKEFKGSPPHSFSVEEETPILVPKISNKEALKKCVDDM